MSKAPYTDALRQTGVLAKLAAYDPHVAGTPPLGVDLPGSDLDILCHAPDPASFAAVVWDAFSDREDFSMRQWRDSPRPVVVGFVAAGWRVEVFAQALPVRDQHGWRHFLAERRLLTLGGNAFRDAVMAHRLRGAKTEPAFARALGLAGDPYQALLDVGRLSDAALAGLLRGAGFECGTAGSA